MHSLLPSGEKPETGSCHAVNAKAEIDYFSTSDDAKKKLMFKNETSDMSVNAESVHLTLSQISLQFVRLRKSRPF